MATYPVSPKAYPASPKAYPASPKAYPGASAKTYPSTGGDTTPPNLVSAVIPAAGTTLVLTYDEGLDAASTPAAGAYSLGGTSRTVSSVGISGSDVTLTLSGVIGIGVVVTVSYTAGGSPVQDSAGNDAANLTNQAVTNNSTQDVTAPTLSSAAINSSGTTLTLTYNEALDATSTPATGAFSLAGTSSTVSSVLVSGSTVQLTITAAYSFQTITVSYTPGANPIRDVAGNNAASLSGQAVTNNTSSRATDPLTLVSSVNAAFYLHADLGITLSGSNVTAWTDQSAAGNSAAQGTGTAEPTYNSTGLGASRATVSFDGTTDVMGFSTWNPPAPGTTNIWFLIVFRQHSWTSGDSVYGGGGTTTLRLRQGGAGTPALGASNGVTGPDNAGAVINTWVRGEHLFSNSTSDYVKLAATTATGTNTGNTDAAAGAFVIGGHTGAAGFSDIEVALFAAFLGKPNAGEITNINSAIGSYWSGAIST